MTDANDYSQPPLLRGKPTTSGLRLHTPPPLTDSGAESKKLALLKPVEIRVTPCLVKQPPSQQPLFESSASHQSDLGSEATVTYESDSVKPSAYKLRERRHRRLSSSSDSDSEDTFKGSVIEHITEIRKSPRQKAARRKGARDLVYKDLSSSEIESMEDVESMDTATSNGAEDNTDLSDGTKWSKHGGSKSTRIHDGSMPTTIRKSAKLRHLKSSSKRVSPKKRHSSSEPEGSRRDRVSERELRRSDRKRDLKFRISSPNGRDSSQESDKSRKSQTTLRNGRIQDLNKSEFQIGSPQRRDSSQESDNSRKNERKGDCGFQVDSPRKRGSSYVSTRSRTVVRRSERKRDLDKAEFQFSSPHKRDSSQESGNSRSSIAATVELRRSERKRGLEKADIGTNSLHKRESSLESECSQSSEVVARELRRSHRKHGLEDGTQSPRKTRDSSPESEKSRKSRATAERLTKIRKHGLDEGQKECPHKRGTSIESEKSRKSAATAFKLRRSERKHCSDMETRSPYKDDSSSESDSTRKSAPDPRSKRRRNLNKGDLRTSSSHKRDNSSESASDSTRNLNTAAMALRSSKANQNLVKVNIQAHSPHKRESSSEPEGSTEEGSMLRRSTRTRHTKVDLKIKSPKKQPSSASHTESGSQLEHVLRSHRQFVLGLREKGSPAELHSHYLHGQNPLSNPIVSELNSKYPSLFTSGSDRSDTECEVEEEGRNGKSSHCSEKGQTTSKAAHDANLLPKVIDYIATELGKEDGTNATSHASTKATTIRTKDSSDTASDEGRKCIQSKNSSRGRSLPSATRSAGENDKGMSLKTATLATNAVVQGSDGVASKDATTSNFYGHILGSHPGIKRPSVSPQPSVGQNSLSPKNVGDKKINEGHAEHGDLTSEQSQTKEVVLHDQATQTPPNHQRIGKSKTDGDLGPRKHTNHSSSPRKKECDRGKGDLHRMKSTIEEVGNKFSTRRSPRMHASSAALELGVHQGRSSQLLTEKSSERLDNAKDDSTSPRHHASAQNLATVTDSATSTRAVTSGDTLPKSPAKRQKSSIKSLTPNEARTSLPSSLPQSFRRPKKRLNFNQNNSGGDSDSSLKNAVKRVRFATSSDSEELSETDNMLLTIASESSLERVPPSKGPAVDSTTVEASSAEASLQVASEITVSSNASGSSQSPNLLSSSPIGGKKRRRTTKKTSVPQTPPTQLSLRGDDGVRLPTPPAGTSTVLRCDDSSGPDTVQSNGSSGIRTVLSQVSQLRCRGRQSKKNGRSMPGKKVRSKTAESSRSPSAQHNASSSRGNKPSAATGKSPQNKNGGTTRGTTNGTVGGERTKKRSTSKNSGSSDRDESVVSPARPKKRKKESDHEKVSAANARSPKRRRIREQHSLSSGRGTGRSNNEEAPSHCGSQEGEHIAASAIGDATSVGRSDKEEAPSHRESERGDPFTSGHATSAGRSDREGGVFVTASSGDSTKSVFTTVPSSSRALLCMGTPSSFDPLTRPVPSLATTSTSGEANNHAALEKSNRAIEPAPVDDNLMIQSPEIDVVGYTPEYSEPMEAAGDATVGSECQSHAQLVAIPGYQSNPLNAADNLSHPLYPSNNSGLPSTNLSISNRSVSSNSDTLVGMQAPNGGYPHTTNLHQSTSSNLNRPVCTQPSYTSGPRVSLNQSIADRVLYMHHPHTSTTGCTNATGFKAYLSARSNGDRPVSTHSPYVSSSGHVHVRADVSQPTRSNADRRASTRTPYVSKNGQPLAVMNQSTLFNIDRPVNMQTPHTPIIINERPRTYANQSTPSNTNRLSYTRTPYTPVNNIGRPRCNLSTWYHENSPGNSPEIGLMNLPVRTETPRSSSHDQQRLFMSSNLGVYPQAETGRHERLNLIDDEYEMSQQVQSQYYHAPVQILLARQMNSFSDNESVVSDSSASILSVPR